MVSLLLPPKSGRVPIASFCVEHGRWSPRGARGCGQVLDLDRKRAVARDEAGDAGAARRPTSDLTGQAAGGNRPAPAEGVGRRAGDAAAAQRRHRRRCARGGLRVKPAARAGKRKARRGTQAYVAALTAAAKDDDIIGYVFAVNGKLNSGDVYASNALFRKMWPKLLDRQRDRGDRPSRRSSGEPPPVDAVLAFLSSAEAGKASEKPLNFGVNRVTRASAGRLSVRDRQAGRLGAPQLSGEVSVESACVVGVALP